MRISQHHIDTFHHQGFAVVENFLTREEVASALAGFHEVFAPTPDQRRAGKQVDGAQALFPWDHSGLNHAATHPDIIDAAERVIGTREIRLSDSDVNVRYAGEDVDDGFHVDVGNNTLGPVVPEDHGNMTFSMTLTDVKPGMSPTRMVPWGRPDSEAVEMTLPAGSLYFYSTHVTRHSASKFTAPSGFRAAMWTIWSRKDRIWDCGRGYTYKWCGGHKDAALKRFIAESDPRRLELLGFPAPGDPLWNETFIAGMAARYPGFNTAPYLDALAVTSGASPLRP